MVVLWVFGVEILEAVRTQAIAMVIWFVRKRGL